MNKELMCSGEVLEEEVQKFCKRNNQDEGEIWQVINRIHTRNFDRNIMYEKQQEEIRDGVGDIPMAQQFAKEKMVSNVIYILQGLQKCCDEGWDFE